MTEKEKELKMLEAFGLKVGNRVKVGECIYKIVEDGNRIILQTKKNDVNRSFNIAALLLYNWEKTKPSIADKKCKDFDECDGCPLIDWLCSDLLGEDLSDKTLGEVYEKFEKKLLEAKREIYGEVE